MDCHNPLQLINTRQPNNLVYDQILSLQSLYKQQEPDWNWRGQNIEKNAVNHRTEIIASFCNLEYMKDFHGDDMWKKTTYLSNLSNLII